MTIYSEFVKSWASEHNLTYGCAVSKPEIKRDYALFKTGEYEISITPAPKAKAKRPKKQAKECLGMCSEDRNVLMRKAPFTSSQLQQAMSNLTTEIIPKAKAKRPTKQAKERLGMGSEDRNVIMRKAPFTSSELQQAMSNLTTDFVPKAKAKRLTKQAKERLGMSSLSSIPDDVSELTDASYMSVPKAKTRKSTSTKEDKIRKLTEKIRKLGKKRDEVSDREDIVLKKINATKNPSNILIKQATNLRKKFQELNEDIGNISDKIYKMR